MRNNFFFLYVLLVAAQMLICNYLHLTSYVMLSLLPAMILCLPTKIGTPAALLIAFATGTAVDLIAEGALGINTVALLPVALLRRRICDFIFGEELVVRGEDFSIREIAEMVAKHTGFKGTIVWDPTKPDGMMRKCLDVSRMKAMGFEPKISLDEGIDNVIKEYKQYKKNQDL